MPTPRLPQRYEPAVPVTDLHEHPRNARRGDTVAIGASMEALGFYGAVIAQEGTGEILVGNHRYRTAVARGEPDVPVLWLDVPDAETAVRVMVGDNRTSDLAENDSPALAALLAELAETDRGLRGTGYMDDDLRQLLGEKPPAKTDPDHIPEPPGEPITRAGDLWHLGPHRLVCGDCTDPAVHERLLGGTAVDLVLTDPPYGVNIDYGVGIGDYEPFDDTPEYLDHLIAGFLPIVRQWPVVLATTGNRCLWRYPAPDWLLAWIVPAGNGPGPWGFTTWTPIVAYGRDPYLARGMGSRPDSVTMMATRDPSVEGHPVIKPIEVWKWLMERGSPERDQVVLDPFGGSGTSIIAAHALGRRCMAIELSPNFCDVICRRYQEHTGVVPVLEATGEAHDFTVPAEATV
jgi:site-specific DNA-methyltransferase (adenine-specific)